MLLTSQEKDAALVELGRVMRERHRCDVHHAIDVGTAAVAIGATQAEIDDLARVLQSTDEP